MRRPILPAVALALVVAASAAAHDTGLDGLYTGTDDDAHKCHHLQVAYWNDMIERALGEMWLLRYGHARPKQLNSDLSEAQKKLARSAREGLDTKRKAFAVKKELAKLYGCVPWPPSGGNE